MATEAQAARADVVAGHSWPLAGREREIDAVRRALRGPRARSAVLVGTAGVGKTRLAREARQLAEAAGRTTLWVTATHSTAGTPLGVFAALLPDAGSSAGTDTLQDLLRRSAAQLVERARGRPLVLFVDDAQLLDEPSAGLIHQLVATDTVMVVATVRSGERVPDAITSLWKDDLADRIELAQLDVPAVSDLLVAALGGPADPAAVVEFATRSGGNVLFLRELVLGALSDGTLVDEEGLWRLRAGLSPSDRLVELVDARLRDLDPASLELLRLAAYAEPLGTRELEMAGGPEAVERLERAGLVVTELDGRRVQLRVSHPVYADVVRRSTSAVRQALMARQLADATEAGGARRREDALRIGIWRMEGGGGTNPDVLLRAALDARWRYDFALAERLARAAVDAGVGFPARLLAAQTVALQGRPDDAADELSLLAEFVRTDAERAELAVVHIECLWMQLGRTAEGLRVAARAEEAISDPKLRLAVSARRPGLLLADSGPGPAAAAAAELVPEADPLSAAWLHLVEAYGLGRLGRISEALEYSRSGYAMAIELGSGDWYPWFYLFTQCEALGHAGRFAEAESLARAEYQRGLAEGSSEARAYFLWHLTRTVRERGDVSGAARDAREAITLLRRLGRRGFEHSLRSTLALALAVAGDFRRATQALVGADSLDVDPPQWSATDHLAARAWTAAAEGRLAAAREDLLAAADVGERIGDLVGAVAALHDVARLGEPFRVDVRLREVAAGVGGELALARCAHVRALVEGDAEALERAATEFDRLGAALLAAEAAADAATAWERAGRAERAGRELHRAAAFARGCPGAATPALIPLSSCEPLTSAERETALLAVSGRTNREIAEELQLSVRTIDNRLQRIYAKLGISRRSDLERLVR